MTADSEKKLSGGDPLPFIDRDFLQTSVYPCTQLNEIGVMNARDVLLTVWHIHDHGGSHRERFFHLMSGRIGRLVAGIQQQKGGQADDCSQSGTFFDDVFIWDHENGISI